MKNNLLRRRDVIDRSGHPVEAARQPRQPAARGDWLIPLAT